MDPLLQSTLDELIFKKSGIEASRNKILTLALGSSHGDFGFNPEFFPGSYNLCTSSQDLFYSASLYRYCIEIIGGGVSNIILFYSSFAPGFELAKCGAKIMCAAYKEIFGIDFEHKDPSINAAYLGIASQYRNQSVESNTFGFKKTNDRPFSTGISGAVRVKDHLPFTLIENPQNKFVNQLPWLLDIINTAKQRNHKLTIVIPPARSDYRQALPDKTIVFSKLYELYRLLQSQDAFKLLDFYDDADYLDEEFGDCDHLLPAGKGAERMTKAIYLSQTEQA